jgi:hypothetical protein
MTTYKGKYKTDYKNFVIVQVGPVIYTRHFRLNTANTSRVVAPYIALAILEKSEDFFSSEIAPGEESGSFMLVSSKPDHFVVTLFKESDKDVSG